MSMFGKGFSESTTPIEVRRWRQDRYLLAYSELLTRATAVAMNTLGNSGCGFEIHTRSTGGPVPQIVWQTPQESFIQEPDEPLADAIVSSLAKMRSNLEKLSAAIAADFAADRKGWDIPEPLRDDERIHTIEDDLAKGDVVFDEIYEQAAILDDWLSTIVGECFHFGGLISGPRVRIDWLKLEVNETPVEECYKASYSWQTPEFSVSLRASNDERIAAVATALRKEAADMLAAASRLEQQWNDWGRAEIGNAQSKVKVGEPSVFAEKKEGGVA